MAAATTIALACLGGVGAPALADQSIPYQVQAGDTVFDIARQFGVSIDEIARVNGLPDPDVLSIGQVLIIKVPDPPTAPGAASRDQPVELASFAHAADLAVSTADSSPSAPSVNVGVFVPADRDLSQLLPATEPATPSEPPLPTSTIIQAPYDSQFDGSIWAETNCGPTSLSMALGALGVNVDQITLRRLANQQMGYAGPDSGTTWESLAYAAKVNGVANEGLYNGKRYRSWSLDELKAELAKGHPVLLLVRYWDLPDHVGSSFAGDHYVVALGFDAAGDLVYHDPAFKISPGSNRVMTPAQLDRAWTNTAVGLVRTAMALVK